MEKMNINFDEIARICGVSKSMVSRVVNNYPHVNPEKRKRILRALREVNYKNNLLSLSEFDSMLALIVPDLHDHYQGQLVKEIILQARKLKYNVIVYDSNNSLETELNLLKHIQKQSIKGLLFSKSNVPDLGGKVAHCLKSIKCYKVLIDQDVKNADLDSVLIHNEKSAYKLMQTVLEKTAADFIVIAGSKDTKVSNDRLKGVFNAAKDQGINIIPDQIIHASFGRKEIVADVLDKHFPRGENIPKHVVCFNNIITFYTICFLRKRGYAIGKDYDIFCFDRIVYLEELGYPMTTVSVDAKVIAQKSVEILLDRIENEESNSIPQLHLRFEAKLERINIK